MLRLCTAFGKLKSQHFLPLFEAQTRDSWFCKSLLAISAHPFDWLRLGVDPSCKIPIFSQSVVKLDEKSAVPWSVNTTAIWGIIPKKVLNASVTGLLFSVLMGIAHIYDESLSTKVRIYLKPLFDLGIYNISRFHTFPGVSSLPYFLCDPLVCRVFRSWFSLQNKQLCAIFFIHSSLLGA